MPTPPGNNPPSGDEPELSPEVATPGPADVPALDPSEPVLDPIEPSPEPDEPEPADEPAVEPEPPDEPTEGQGAAVAALAVPVSGVSGPLIAADHQGSVVISSGAYDPSAWGIESDTVLGPPFVARLDPELAVADFIDFPGSAAPEVLAVGPNGEVAIAGQLISDVSFGGEILSAAPEGYFLVLLDADLNHANSVRVDRGTDPFLQALTFDAQGNVYVALEEVDYQVLSARTRVTKFDPQLNELWTQIFVGTDTTAYPNDIAIAPNGEVVVAGAFSASLTFGDVVLTSLAESGGFSSYNGFVARLAPDTGEALFAFRFGGATFDLANSVDVTSSGMLRVAGQVSAQSDIGGLTVMADAEGSAFVAEFSPDGEGLWAWVHDGPGIVFGAATRGEATVAVGRFDGPGAIDLAASRSFVAFAESEQERQLLGEFPTAANGASGAAIDDSGSVWVTGTFSGAVDFGSGPIDSDFGNGFVIRFAP